MKKPMFCAFIVFAVLAAAVAIERHFSMRRGAGIPALPTANAKSTDAAGRRILYYWDPMLGPSSISDHPGISAMKMKLVPVYADQVSSGAQIAIDPRIVQDMGVQTTLVTRGPMHRTVRTFGEFRIPETGLHDVSLKIGGWIDKLYADQNGMHVRRGDPLFAMYSPELQVAEQELIGAVKSRDALPAGASEALRNESADLIASARRKFELWDVDPREIEAIAASQTAPKDVTFFSPAFGNVEEKAIVRGSAVQPGARLMRIADHSTIWLDAEVYEAQIPLIRMGQAVNVTLEAVPGKKLTSKIDFVYPHLDHMTRTLMVRATFANPSFVLKPGMYAQADIDTEPISDALQIPAEAVIDTGTRQIVFVADGDGHFSPRSVRVGIRGDDDRIQIIGGLTVNERVVISGQFLMDVESRTQEAIAKLRGARSAAH